MAILRPSRSAIRALISSTPKPSIVNSTSIRTFTASQLKAAASAPDAHDAHVHEEHFEPPSGWLFGVKPGEKYEKEGWENIWYWGFFGSLGLAVVGWAFKPDTSIQTWALEEARRRLEVEGILKEPEDKA